MTESDFAEPIYRYLVLQRCRPYGNWPEHYLYQDDQRPCIIAENGEVFSLQLRFGVKTHGTPSTQADHPDGQQQSVGRLVVDDRHRAGFWMGGNFFHSPDELTEVELKLRNAEPGEIDFFVGIGCRKELALDFVQRNLSPLLVTFITTFSVRTGDIIVSTAPMSVSRLLDGGRSEMSAGMPVKVRNRLTLTPDSIERSFAPFFDMIRTLSNEDARRVSVAMRRYQSSLSEADPVDRFCDLWESCEFLGKCVKQGNGKRVGGHVDFVIAYAVGTQMHVAQPVILKKVVQPLYDVRKDLVHNAMENPAQFEELINILEDVAIQMIRLVFSLPPGDAPYIEGRLACE